MIFFTLLYNNFYLIKKELDRPQDTFAHAFSRLISDGIGRVNVHKSTLQGAGFCTLTI